MTREELIDYCAGLFNARIDCPFEGDPDTLVARHGENRKWFALLHRHGGPDQVNLKCEELRADFWRSAFEGVGVAWHMNKRLWITVRLKSDVPEDVLRIMVEESFRLTI